MEKTRKSRRCRRPDQAFYVPPARRSMISTANTQASHSGGDHGTGMSTGSSDTSIITYKGVVDRIHSNDDNISQDDIVKILDFFHNLHDGQMIRMGDSLIKFSVFLIEHRSLSLSIMEKWAVTLSKVGKSLEQKYSDELDSLLVVVRDKLIEDSTLPDTRRYLWSVIESRAKNWNTRNV